jgi:hypothetical protein
VTTQDLEETSRLTQRGRYKAASRALAPLLSKYPSSPRVLAAKANLDALMKVTSLEESEAVVRELISENPDNYRLRIVAAYLEARGGARESAIEELRVVVGEHPDEAYAHQSLAGLLHLDKEDWSESWHEYEIALASGPLSSPCFKTAAFQVARRVDPDNANMALKGSSMLERAGMHTRVRGPRQMFFIFAALYVAGVLLLGSPNHTAGLAVGSLAVLSTLWNAYTNDFACCKKCRNFWFVLGLVALTSFAFAYGVGKANAGFKSIFLIEIAVVIAASAIRLRRQRSANSRQESREGTEAQM